MGCVLGIALSAQTIVLTPFASGLNTPVGMEFAPGDNNMYVVEQQGRIRLVSPAGTLAGTDFLDISSLVTPTGGEQGLLGLAFHPDYASNGYFFVNYTKAADGATRISRFSRSSANPLAADPGSEVPVLEIAQPYSNHNGGCIEFGPDGYLYIGMGDGGSAGDPGNRAQNPTELLGKLLRIDVNTLPYQIPATNPYAGQTDTLPQIWAMGLRNPWRFSFDRLTGDLWIGDVGQGNWEEVDFQAASSAGGENYGWRCYEGAAAYSTGGCQPQSFYKAPVNTFSHANGNCSITGGYLYRGASEGDLYNKYIYTDYCSGTFYETHRNGNGWTSNVLNSFSHSFSTFAEDHQGELYIADVSSGGIYRISTSACSPTAFISEEHEQTVLCAGDSLHLSTPQGSGLTYQWLRNGTAIGNATSNAYDAALAGNYRVVVKNSSNCSDTSGVYTISNGNCTVSVEEEDLTVNEWNLYPNPAKDNITMQVIASKPLAVIVRLVAIDGRILRELPQQLTPGDNRVNIPLGGLVAGLYEMQLIHQGTWVQPVVVLNED